MSLQQCSAPGEDNNLVYWCSASHNPFGGCPIQRVPLPCHLFGRGRFCPAQGRCKTHLYVDISVQVHREAIEKATACRATLVPKKQRNSFAILTFVCEDTGRSIGVNESPPIWTALTIVFELYGAFHVRSKKIGTGFRTKFGANAASNLPWMLHCRSRCFKVYPPAARPRAGDCH